jgi:hypothetical protein
VVRSIYYSYSIEDFDNYAEFIEKIRRDGDSGDLTASNG